MTMANPVFSSTTSNQPSTSYYNSSLFTANTTTYTPSLYSNTFNLNDYVQQLFNNVKGLRIETSNSNNSSLSNTGYKSSLNLGFGQNIVNTAKSYLGYNETDGSYKIFTNGRNEAWCADFVTHVVKESAKKSGKTLPSDFGSSSVSGLINWGIKNNCYLETANKSSLISKNVKPGDIVIFKENGKSHTALVKDIKNGTIYTIEGNTSDKVAERSYAINDSNISGFIQIA
jgi:hypothetical protein